jgi:hypothetical protein
MERQRVLNLDKLKAQNLLVYLKGLRLESLMEFGTDLQKDVRKVELWGMKMG